MSETKALTAKEVRRRIRVKYGKTSDALAIPEHAVLYEVPVDGVSRTWRGRELDQPRAIRRRIDAVAVGLWRGTGHLVHGFEVKVSRSDLLTELREPEKAACAFALVDRWWLVLGDPKLLRDGDELPENWGVLACRGKGLGVVRQAGPAGGQHGGRFIAALVANAIAARGSITRGLGYVDGYNAAYELAYNRGLEAGRNAEAMKQFLRRSEAEASTT